MSLVFFKAQIKGGAHHDLFVSPTQVKGHLRGGTFVGPYIAVRKKAAPEIAQTRLIFVQHAPMQQTVVEPPRPAVVIRPQATDDAKRKTQAAKLREAGRRIIEAADAESGRDRLANTRKRVQEAASSIGNAQREGRIGQTMLNLADAIEQGRARSLAGITSRAAVETLDELLRDARVSRWRAESSAKPSRQSHVDWEEAHHRPVEPEDIRHGSLPVPRLWGHTAKDLLAASDVLGVARGHKPILDWLRGFASYDGGSHPTAEQMVQLRALADAMEPKIREHKDDYRSHYTLRNAASSGWSAIRVVRELSTKRNRYAKLGLSSDEDVQRALTEYAEYRGGVKAEDPIKKRERDLVGTKPGVDFFPTPPPLAARMVALAHIKPGMRVLEPSAGKGDIADQIRQAGGEVEAAEISAVLRDLIEAKGHKLVGRDFEEFTPETPYDAVVMNPPWGGGADVRHVMRAYGMLKSGGRLVALISPHASFANDRASTEFRAFLASHGAETESLPAEAFHSQWMSGGIRSWLIAIDKP